MFVIDNFHPNLILLGLTFLSLTYIMMTALIVYSAVQMIRDFKGHIPKNGGIVPIMFVILAAIMMVSCTVITSITIDFPEIYMLLHQ